MKNEVLFIFILVFLISLFSISISAIQNCSPIYENNSYGGKNCILNCECISSSDETSNESLFPEEVKEKVPESVISCYESDGINYYTKGVSCLGEGNSSLCRLDYCLDSSNLREFYIENEGIYNETSCSNYADIFYVDYSCEKGCSDGVCKSSNDCIPQYEKKADGVYQCISNCDCLKEVSVEECIPTYEKKK